MLPRRRVSCPGRRSSAKEGGYCAQEKQILRPGERLHVLGGVTAHKGGYDAADSVPITVPFTTLHDFALRGSLCPPYSRRSGFFSNHFTP